MRSMKTDCLDREFGSWTDAEEVAVAAASAAQRRRLWKSSTRSPPLALLALLRLY